METVEEYYAGLPEQSPGLKAVGSQILSLSKLAAYKLGDRWTTDPLPPGVGASWARVRPKIPHVPAHHAGGLCYAAHLGQASLTVQDEVEDERRGNHVKC
jgi:hypothetical protein